MVSLEEGLNRHPNPLYSKADRKKYFLTSSITLHTDQSIWVDDIYAG